MSLNLLSKAKAKFKSFLNLYRTPTIKDESKFLVAQLGASGKIGDGLLQYSIISIKDKDPKFEKDLIYPLAKDHHHPSSICKGLLLLLVRGKDTKPPGETLWNPTTGEVKTLPPPPSSFDSSMSLNLFAHAKSKFKSFLNLCTTSTIKDVSKFLVVSPEVDNGCLHYSIISIKDELPQLEKHLEYPMAQEQGKHYPSSICNGLLLLLVPPSYDPVTFEMKRPIIKMTKPPGEALWNPTTKEFKILPPPPSSFDKRCVKMFQGYFGFGFDSASEDYKVIRLLKLGDGKTEGYPLTPAVMAEVYSLTSNSWKQVSVVHPLRIPRHSGVHVNGTYYWLNLSDPWFIVSFDFATEKFASSVIPAPPSDKLTRRNAYFDNIKLVEYCGLLGAMVISGGSTWPRSLGAMVISGEDMWPSPLENPRSLEIWVWDGSWSLVSTLTVPNFAGFWTLVGTDKLIFLDWTGKPMFYDCATSKLKTIRSLPTSFNAHIFPFVESNVPLDAAQE
ncbi:F-box protein [Striga asiatica]|uniref:F-box protein n=1 Tax=Striga asiatica TaxID=4170 RepID=A0A5A7RI02_STRAF|nr:F-box protein [Striga asiatica]